MAKRISAIVSLVVIGILILTTIIMATIDVDHKINCNKPDAIYVRYNSSDRNTSEEQQKSIIDFIDNASKEKSLTALFNGHIGDQANLTLISTTPVEIKDNSEFFVIYHYTTAQDLIVNNKIEKDENDQDIKYKELAFSIDKTQGLHDVKVYITPEGASAFTYSRYYNVRADFSDLYNYLVTEGFKN